eukprot:5610349-Amphidinium_carterae.1
MTRGAVEKNELVRLIEDYQAGIRPKKASQPPARARPSVAAPSIAKAAPRLRTVRMSAPSEHSRRLSFCDFVRLSSQ